MNMQELERAREYHRQREAQRRTQREAERQAWLHRTREAIMLLVPDHQGVQRVFLYGSLVQPGRFRPESDIDIAVDCETLETESAFWRALERELGRDVDLRPLTGPIAAAVANEGEHVYGRQDSPVSE